MLVTLLFIAPSPGFPGIAEEFDVEEVPKVLESRLVVVVVVEGVEFGGTPTSLTKKGFSLFVGKTDDADVEGAGFPSGITFGGQSILFTKL